MLGIFTIICNSAFPCDGFLSDKRHIFYPYKNRKCGMTRIKSLPSVKVGLMVMFVAT